MSVEANCCKPSGQDLKMQNNAKNLLVVAVALLDSDNRILIAQRPKGKNMDGLWEFPGGKVNTDEAPQIALAREIQEELGIKICTGCQLPLNFSSYRYEDFHLVLLLFACRNWEGTPQGLEGQQLKWIKIGDINNYPMPPADEVLVATLRDYLG